MLVTSRDTESLARFNRGEFKLLVNYNLMAITAHSVTIRARGIEKTESLPADRVTATSAI
jgi:hypothetical protein